MYKDPRVKGPYLGPMKTGAPKTPVSPRASGKRASGGHQTASANQPTWQQEVYDGLGFRVCVDRHVGKI